MNDESALIKSGLREQLRARLRGVSAARRILGSAQARALLDAVKEKMPLIQKWQQSDPESKQLMEEDRMR